MGVTNTNMDYAGECDPTNNGSHFKKTFNTEPAIAPTVVNSEQDEEKPDLLKSFLTQKVDVVIKKRHISDDAVLQYDYVFLPVLYSGKEQIVFNDLKGNEHSIHYRDRKYFTNTMQPLEVAEGTTPKIHSLIVNVETRKVYGVIPVPETGDSK